MRYKLKIVSAVIVPSLVGPVLAESFTYKDVRKQQRSGGAVTSLALPRICLLSHSQTRYRRIRYGRF